MIVALAWIMLSGVQQAAEKAKLKIINWNVLYGFNHHQSIKDANNWLNDQNPDVIAFQELNGISEAELSEHAKMWGHSFAVTHKEDGFPVGLTSNKPIEVLSREVKGYHHGFLHCKTYGLHFFVVHFWPGKFTDVHEILNRATPLLKKKDSVIILGDFNGCSRKDETFLNTHATKREPDYTFVDLVEARGFIDLVHKHDPMAKISCPSSITIPQWSKNREELELKRYRIDFVFADPLLATHSASGTISLASEIESISDHYPVIVEFLWDATEGSASHP